MIEFKNFRKVLQFHTELNQKLWDGVQLKKSVRKKILNVTSYFLKHCKIEDLVEDIVFVGGNANYNYTNLSDIDIHVIIDFSKIPHGSLDLHEVYRDKRDLWKKNHDVELYGYPLEFYVQDIKDVFPQYQGVFSVYRNKWIHKPEAVSIDYSHPYIIEKVNYYVKLINNSIQNNADYDIIKKIKNKLKTYRGAGLQRGGEFSYENLVYKVLRGLGYLDKLNKYEIKLVNNSINEN